MSIDTDAPAKTAALSQADFISVPAQPVEVSVYPTSGGADTIEQSYWSRVWRRFRQHPAALPALIVLGLIVAVCLSGPLWWSVSPYQQSISEVSQLPGLSRSARVIRHDRAWQGSAEPVSRESLFQATVPDSVSDLQQTMMQVQEANTERVRLQWPAVVDAIGYRVYRSERLPLDLQDLGVSLATLRGPFARRYEDRLNLSVQEYFYTLVILYRAQTGASREMPVAVVAVTPEQAVSAFEAELNGLAVMEAADGKGYVQLAAHPLGTDYLGRDILARLIQGARTSLLIGLLAPLFIVLLGSCYGALAAFTGGRIDEVMMRFADFVVALPFLLFMILFKVIFGIGPGNTGVLPMMIALVILSWPTTARLIRGQVMQLRSESFVLAARLFGSGTMGILWRHILPNILGVMLVAFSFAVPTAIFTEAFLSFIGLGVSAPASSWGSMCNEGIRTFLHSPHQLLFPALMISLTVLAFNVLGDALRDALDVKMDD